MSIISTDVYPVADNVTDYNFRNKCDSCPATVVYRVYKLGVTTSILQFCNHHAHKNFPAMTSRGWSFAKITGEKDGLS